ncbi:MAG TPA: glutaredoxin 3 [Gammaproteobacteria bacterium]|nr:glutaredoxin 3 [Gammaproteobacteria bacterium]
MVEIIMYSTRFCPYCISADRLLNRKGVPINKIAVDHDPDMWATMEKLSGRSTVPQIFIGNYHVGGYDDLAALERNGKLDPLLGPIPGASLA